MKFINPIFFFLLISIPIVFRMYWNDPFVFVGSDPQIKYYQTIQILEKGFSREILYCYFPGESLGFSSKFIPLGYPWAFVRDSGECYFQYPLIMPLIHATLASVFSKHIITYLPILFFIINILISVQIFLSLGVERTYAIFFSISMHLFSPIFLSSLDYSELTLTNTSLLSTVFLFLLNWKSIKNYKLLTILTGFFFAFNFQLRPESTIGLLLFFFFFFVFSNSFKETFMRLLPLSGLVIFFTLIASYLNKILFNHPLGMRGWNTLQDASGNLTRNYYNDWITDLWGSNFKIGIFQGYPILFFMILLVIITFFINKQIYSKNNSLLFFLTGATFIFVLPILSPYRAGVDIFGLRYYESGVYFLVFGFLSLFYHIIFSFNIYSRYKYYIYIILFISTSLLYFSYKSDLRALKNWSGGVKGYQIIQSKLNEIQPQIIIHRGLSLSYLMGTSYEKYPQIAIFSQNDWDSILPILKKSGIEKILYLEWEGNPLVKEEFPESIWKEKFDINFHLELSKEWSVVHIQLAHFKGNLISPALPALQNHHAE